MRRIAATGLLLGLLAFPGAGRAGATPPETGCPSGYLVLSVETLTDHPYQLPAIIDNGGNSNGYVCGLPLPGAVSDAYGVPGRQLYIFVDDNSPARK